MGNRLWLFLGFLFAAGVPAVAAEPEIPVSAVQQEILSCGTAYDACVLFGRDMRECTGALDTCLTIVAARADAVPAPTVAPVTAPAPPAGTQWQFCAFCP